MNKTVAASLAIFLAAMGQVQAQQTVVISEHCCAPQVSCCEPSCGPKCWVSADYLLWWIRENQHNTPLLTTGPGSATSGPIGAPDTQVLLSGADIDRDLFSGVRLNIGGWLGSNRLVGAEFSGFLLERKSFIYEAVSDANGSPQIAIPFNDVNGVNNLGESFADTAFPGFVAGRADVNASVRLWGMEGNGLVNLVENGGLNIQFLAGFRYLDMLENFSTVENYAVIPGSPFVAVFLDVDSEGPFTVTDIFRTRNQFYGGQIGARFNYETERLLVGLTTKVALGSTSHTLIIEGQTTSADPANSGTAPGGVFAVPSNIGRHTDSSFTVVPELDLRVGVKLGQNLVAYVGYTFIYWSEVARPVNQIDRNVNGGQQPTYALGFGTGPPLPLPAITTTDFWAQGINFGLEFRY